MNSFPAPTFISIKHDGLKVGDEITVKYKISTHFPAYLTVCLVLVDVLDNKIWLPSSTQLKKSPNLLDYHYIYETTATLIDSVDSGIEFHLVISDKKFGNCGFYHVKNVRNNSHNPNTIRTKCTETKCANCDIKKTPVWRFLKNREKVCNACYMYFKKNQRNRPVMFRDGNARIIRKNNFATLETI
ncbi:hypothetical protein C1645_733474 [Glomus cerebriforme]|uniref:GATA-type domain-containing protein n=1 Tax=Glomus cerebriforme TaxID=658196 RepID=A0A397TMB1_9GLOM|nr:hypothetical protein C1645_733474 [Glomus cerebriforme]